MSEPYAPDLSDISKKTYPNINFKYCDLLNELYTFEDEFFDVIFSKFLIEHFHYPEKIFKEMNRVLKKKMVK